MSCLCFFWWILQNFDLYSLKLQIEDAVESGIEEAEKIIEEEIESGTETTFEVEDEIFGDEQNEKSSSSSNPDKEVQEQLSEDIINLITENDEPSKDIDLGSVQEV